MKKNLEDIVAAGICTFQPGIDRDQDGYGYLVERQPAQACPTPCEYCKAQASYIVRMIEENDANHQQEDGFYSPVPEDRRHCKRD